MFSQFIKERRYLSNVSPRAIESYQESFNDPNVAGAICPRQVARSYPGRLQLVVHVVERSITFLAAYCWATWTIHHPQLAAQLPIRVVLDSDRERDVRLGSVRQEREVPLFELEPS